MNIGVEELKAKKKSLMASFRPLVNKKKASLRSGSSAEDVYQPTWFAYDAMELFLGSIYDVKKTINTEDDVSSLILFNLQYLKNNDDVEMKVACVFVCMCKCICLS